MDLPWKHRRNKVSEDRDALVKRAKFVVPKLDGENIPGSPTWIYHQQHFLTERNMKWLADLKSCSTNLISMNAHLTGNYWASSPLLSKALVRGHKDTRRVPLDIFFNDMNRDFSSDILLFMTKGQSPSGVEEYRV
jgi:hypothetical protein